MNENEIGNIVLDCAIELHRALGPGLLETVYETILADQLQEAGLDVVRQQAVPIIYEGVRFDQGFRADLVVNRRVVLELKSIEKTHPVHKKQVLTYLKLMDLRLGYLLNFGDEVMKNGITRLVNGRIS